MFSGKSFFIHPPAPRPRAAIFISGYGSNAERILEPWFSAKSDCPYEPVVLVTDAPESSRARELGMKFALPVVENDIRRFYRDRGENRISIMTELGRQLREEWTDCLRQQLHAYQIDFGILAGFMPLTNLTGDFPCLNVHPGDLTYEKNGCRWLVGLHAIPVERAILEGLKHMRSSVIVAQPYRDRGQNMDSGPILGISGPVPIERLGNSLEKLEECKRQRPEKKPKGGFNDILEKTAAYNLEKLKTQGDWIVFPQVVLDFARHQFGLDQNGELLYREGDKMDPVKTVIYTGKNKKRVLRKQADLDENRHYQ